MKLTGAHAITLLTNRPGIRMRRSYWAEGCFVALQPALELPPFNDQTTQRKVNDRTAALIGRDTPMTCPAYFAYWDAMIQTFNMGFVFSADDLLASDWETVADDLGLIPEPLPHTVSFGYFNSEYDVRQREYVGVAEVKVTTTFLWKMEVQAAEIENAGGIGSVDATLQSLAMKDVSPFIGILVRDGLTAAIMRTDTPASE